MKRWPLHKAYIWETAPFFRILLPFAAGILCYERSWLFNLSGTSSVFICVLLLLVYQVIILLKKNKDGFAVVPVCLDQLTVESLRGQLGDAERTQRNLLSVPIVRNLVKSRPVREIVEAVLGKQRPSGMW